MAAAELGLSQPGIGFLCVNCRVLEHRCEGRLKRALRWLVSSPWAQFVNLLKQRIVRKRSRITQMLSQPPGSYGVRIDLRSPCATGISSQQVV
jgi:hypothetical protein